MNPRAFLHDDDIVLYAAPTPEAIRSAAVELYHRAQTVARARGPERIDSDGEVHARRWRFTFAEDRESRSERQRRFYFGPVLGQIAAQAAGGWTQEAWHEAFKRTILGFEVVKVKVAGRKGITAYRKLRSTNDLSVKQMSDFLDAVLSTAATDLGVVFDLDPKEREAVRYRRPARKAKTPETEEATA